MVDNNSYMLNTFPPVLSLKCAARLNFNSLSSLFDCVSEGKYLHDSLLAEGGP